MIYIWSKRVPFFERIQSILNGPENLLKNNSPGKLNSISRNRFGTARSSIRLSLSHSLFISFYLSLSLSRFISLSLFFFNQENVLRQPLRGRSTIFWSFSCHRLGFALKWFCDTLFWQIRCFYKGTCLLIFIFLWFSGERLYAVLEIKIILLVFVFFFVCHWKCYHIITAERIGMTFIRTEKKNLKYSVVN